MAKIYPKIENNFNGSYGEKQVFEAFQKLPDDWYVFHSVKWSEKRRSGFVTWGEADFLVVNQQFGILVLEIKSGAISCVEGVFKQKRLDNGQEFDIYPFEQADRSKYKIRDELRKKKLADRCFVDKAVWFPSIDDSFENINLPMEYKKELILDSKALNNPLESIENIFNYYNARSFSALSDEDMKTIIEILIPCFDLVPAYNATKDEINHQFHQLTNEQKKVLDFIENEDNVAVCGAAGTGKTFVAVERANRLSVAGDKVLYLCFNRKLRDYLEENRYEDNIDFLTIYQFLYNRDLLSSDNDLEVDWEAFREYHLKDDEYDYLIIDEAQDLGDEILEKIVRKAKEEGVSISLFYDKNQLVMMNNFPDILNDFDCKLTLKKNCRNTIRIMETANNSIKADPNPSHLSVNGEMPTLYYSTNTQKIFEKIEEKIRQYLQKGYSLNGMVILTMNSEQNTIMKGIEKIGNFKLSPTSCEDCILFTTARKFKGLEADCVMVVDYDLRQYGDLDYSRLFYVASSRARQRLDVFVNVGDREVNDIGRDLDGPFGPIINLSNRLKMMIEKIKE